VGAVTVALVVVAGAPTVAGGAFSF